jgi:phage terminase small subunit
MGRRGPAPQPAAVKELRGARPVRINRAEPVPRAAAIEPPAGLSAEVLAVWDELLPELLAMKIGAKVDADAFASWCRCVAAMRRLDREDLGDPAVITRLLKLGPEMRMWAREFGFTPAARQQIRGPAAGGGAGAERLLA